MTVGEKIKKIRTFRGITQKELGLAVGFEERERITVLPSTKRITVFRKGNCWTRLPRRFG